MRSSRTGVGVLRSAPSSITQAGLWLPRACGECQPLKVLPSNSSTKPSRFSVAVRTLSAQTAQPDSDSSNNTDLIGPPRMKLPLCRRYNGLRMTRRQLGRLAGTAMLPQGAARAATTYSGALDGFESKIDRNSFDPVQY